VKKALKILYPWSELKVNEGFFVPTVTLFKTRMEGLQDAVRQQVRGDATPCIFKGKFGLLFVRKRW